MITIYSMEGCASCVAAAQYLQRSNIDFQVVKVEDSPEAWELMKANNHRSMPQIYKDGKLFVEGGYQGLVKMSFLELKQ